MPAQLKFASIALAAFAAISTATADDVIIEPDKTEPLRLRADVASVVLGNPEVADIAVHSNRMLLVTGRNPGRTNLIIFDKADREIFRGDIVVSEATGTRVRIQRNDAVTAYECVDQCRQVQSEGDATFGSVLDSLIEEERAAQRTQTTTTTTAPPTPR